MFDFNIKDYFNMLLRAFRLLYVGTKVAFITKSTRQRACAFDISHILDQGTLGCQLKGETFLKIHIEKMKYESCSNLRHPVDFKHSIDTVTVSI